MLHNLGDPGLEMGIEIIWKGDGALSTEGDKYRACKRLHLLGTLSARPFNMFEGGSPTSCKENIRLPSALLQALYNYEVAQRHRRPGPQEISPVQVHSSGGLDLPEQLRAGPPALAEGMRREGGTVARAYFTPAGFHCCKSLTLLWGHSSLCWGPSGLPDQDRKEE